MRVVTISDIVHRPSPITETSFFRKANPSKFFRSLTLKKEKDPSAETMLVVSPATMGDAQKISHVCYNAYNQNYLKIDTAGASAT